MKKKTMMQNDTMQIRSSEAKEAASDSWSRQADRRHGGRQEERTRAHPLERSTFAAEVATRSPNSPGAEGQGETKNGKGKRARSGKKRNMIVRLR